MSTVTAVKPTDSISHFSQGKKQQPCGSVKTWSFVSPAILFMVNQGVTVLTRSPCLPPKAAWLMAVT